MLGKAFVYCEGHFGDSDGKTANGLIRHSQKYRISGIIDSTKAGQDAGMVLDHHNNGVEIYRDLPDAMGHQSKTPRYFIYGIAPNDAYLSVPDRRVILKAMSLGMNIVIGLQEFISEDPEFIKQAREFHVKITDTRKPAAKRYLHLFSGDIYQVTIPRVAIFGTDCAIGKRTTAMMLMEALRQRGLKVGFVGTGQTSIIQGEDYGVAMDAIPSEYMAGEFENAVMDAYIHEKPDILIYEGQSALSHEAFVSSCAIIRGGRPNAFIVQHAPQRKERLDFPNLKMPTLTSEIDLIESFAKAKVIALTINHEGMNAQAVQKTVQDYEKAFSIPTADVLCSGCDKLVDAIAQQFPDLLPR